MLVSLELRRSKREIYLSIIVALVAAFVTAARAQVPSSDGATGSRVVLEIRASDGTSIPETLLPLVFTRQEAADAWSAVEFGRPVKVPAPGMKVERLGGGRFAFVPQPGADAYYVLVHHANLIGAYQVGPLSPQSIASGHVAIQLPATATIRVGFDARVPVTTSTANHITAIDIKRLIPFSDLPNPPTRIVGYEGKSTSFTMAVPRLAPGQYVVDAFLGDPTQRTDPRFFHQSTTVTVESGNIYNVAIEYAPFETRNFTGDCSATLNILTHDGKPASHIPYTVEYPVGIYGKLILARGTVPEDGVVTVTRLAGGDPRKTYDVTADDARIGHIGFPDGRRYTETVLRLPPKAGEIAPDTELLDIFPDQLIRLSDFRNKAVLLLFWVSTCDHCNEAMDKLNKLTVTHKTDWADKVLIVGASLDDVSTTVLNHVIEKGWLGIRQTWCPQGALRFESPAARAFEIVDTPTAVIIDRDGRIVWRGHPGEYDAETALNKLLTK